MRTVTKEISFDMGHRLSKYKGKCYNLHGHTYKLLVEVEGDVDELGFVIDFVDLKEVLKDVTDPLDHHTILFIGDAQNVELGKANPNWFVWVNFEPTAENLSKYLYNKIVKHPKWNESKYTLGQVTLWETPTSYASYSEL